MKTSFETLNLTMLEAVMLQQIQEDGEDDIAMLSGQLGMSRSRASSLVDNLKQKGLLLIEHDYQGTWISLSSKGKRLMSYLWPDAPMRAV